MSWDWAHFKGEGWWAHTKRASKLSGLLLLSGLAMLLHMIVPFWQQPKCLQAESIKNKLDKSIFKDRLDKSIRK
jgi:hypothetical protein